MNFISHSTPVEINEFQISAAYYTFLLSCFLLNVTDRLLISSFWTLKMEAVEAPIAVAVPLVVCLIFMISFHVVNKHNRIWHSLLFRTWPHFLFTLEASAIILKYHTQWNNVLKLWSINVNYKMKTLHCWCDLQLKLESLYETGSTLITVANLL